jgi:hypothetical protein
MRCATSSRGATTEIFMRLGPSNLSTQGRKHEFDSSNRWWQRAILATPAIEILGNNFEKKLDSFLRRPGTLSRTTDPGKAGLETGRSSRLSDRLSTRSAQEHGPRRVGSARTGRQIVRKPAAKPRGAPLTGSGQLVRAKQRSNSCSNCLRLVF